MAIKSPSNSQVAPPEKPAAANFDPFHPEMPQIPGVAPRQAKSAKSLDTTRLGPIAGGVAGVLVVSMAIYWWIHKPSQKAIEPSAPDTSAATSVLDTPVPSFGAPVHDGPTVAATVEELSKPWSAKKFTFVKPITGENIEAMVIRLPGGGLWAFASRESSSRCELEFVTDVGRLEAKYEFRGVHPMVVNPCNNTVYDPLKVGSVGGNVWVRGDVVQGAGLRPPISIDVRVKGHSIIADRIE
jgi:hypothetical protein